MAESEPEDELSGAARKKGLLSNEQERFPGQNDTKKQE